MQLTALYRIDTREGAHNRIAIEYGNKKIKIRKYCDTDWDDEFVMKEETKEEKIDLSEAIAFLKKHMDAETSGDDYEITVDGRSISGNYENMPRFLLTFHEMIGYSLDFINESERVKYEITKSRLKKLSDDGTISKGRYNELLKQINERKTVEKCIENKSYPFTRKAKEMIEDYDNGIIAREMFDTFVWCRRNVKQEESNIMYVKLRLSLWGQRLLGRYDTCEYILDGAELSERRYSVHGTLFEGCGNYKAPESAKITKMNPDTSERIFGFVQGLSDSGFLGKDYSSTDADCSFFDLYIRFNDGASSHTKGTSEYPPFVKFIMYMIDAEELI